MRIAILGASHWHVTLMYTDALQQLGHEIVAVGDTTKVAVERACPGIECPRYTDYERLLADSRPDFVFAHAPHSDMTALAAWLVEHKVHFHMEKPMGVDWRELAPVATKAETEKLFTAVALVSRNYALPRWLKDHQAKFGPVRHYYYRLFAGGPARYREWGVEWMLDPQTAGAGPLWNFGPHVVDLFLYLATSDVVEVTARWQRGINHELIEDQATVMMTGADGETGVGEVSYTIPQGYEFFFSLDTDLLHVGTADLGEAIVQWRDGRMEKVCGPGFDDVYFDYTKETLEAFAAGTPPRATIRDMVHTLRVMNAARESAMTKTTVKIDGDEDDA